FRPGVEAGRQDVAVRFRVARGEELHASKTDRIASGPGRQRQQQTNDHPQRCERESSPIRRTTIAEPKRYQGGSKKQGRFGPDERTETNNEPAREPDSHGAEQTAGRGDAAYLHGRWRQEAEKREGGEERCQDLRERHSGGVGG